MTAEILSLSRRVAGLEPSATLAMLGRVKQLRAQGVEMLDLTAGEPDFDAPEPAARAGLEAIEQGRGRYTPAAGTAELRATAAEWVRAEYGLEYDASEVLICPGAKIAINQALMAMVNEGDEVLVLSPYWTSYPDMVRISGGQPVIVPCGADHLPQVETLEAARTSRTRAILLNTPCNPTGAVYPEALLAELGRWAVEHDIWVISDEIYASLIYGDARHVSPLVAHAALRDRGVWIGGISKAYAMTGWRIGFLAAPKELATALATLQSQLVSCPSAISQAGALAALRDGDEARARMRAAFEARCTLVVDGLRAIPGVECPRPQGAFYAFPSIHAYLGKSDPNSGRTIQTGDDFVEWMIEEARVATIAGSAFGNPSSFRISFAASDEVLHQALERMAEFLGRLA